MDYIDLRKLPEEHPLLNKPLGEIGAQFKHCRSPEFITVDQGGPLSKATYNELEGMHSTTLFQWRAPKEPSSHD